MEPVRRELRYGVFVLAVILLGAGGYGAYLVYPRFNLPAVDAVALAALSLAAGVASFFSPCSFPLLATLLVREASAGHAGLDRRVALRQAVVYAAALSLGTVVFLALTATIIAAGGRALVEQVTFTSVTGRVIRVVVGALLVVLGFVQMGRLRLPFHRVADVSKPILQSQARTRRREPVLGFAIFGFAYLLAGFG